MLARSLVASLVPYLKVAEQMEKTRSKEEAGHMWDMRYPLTNGTGFKVVSIATKTPIPARSMAA